MSESSDGSQTRQDRIDEAVAEYLELIDAGQKPDREQWVSRYPDLRDELLAFLAGEAALDATHLVSEDSVSEHSEIDESTAERGGSGSSRKSASSVPENWLRDRKSIGPYRLIRSLGTGGMGQVFEAIDQAGNHVAVKLLLARWMRSPESLKRFRQEGQIASAISHPRCVFVKAADEEDGQPYIVMELMSGKTLKDLLIERKQLPVEEAIRAILDVLEGLEEAHTHGMIHRDIKPANCYLEETGRVKLGDFGLARSMTVDSELTQTGDFIGTPLFASPEQVKGQEIDVRSDIYSVCATLYFLLTGRAPFAGSSATTVIARIVSEDPQSVRELNPQVPVLLERIVMRGLNRNRQERYQTVSELRQLLEPFVSGRQSIAALGRRFAAQQLDSLATGLVVGLVTTQFDPSVAQVPVAVPAYSIIMGLIVAYYLIWEGWGNASPGKWLLKLQIVDQQTGEKPGYLQLIFRTLIAMLLMGIGTDVLLYLFLKDDRPEVWILAQWSGYVLSYLLMLSTLLTGQKGRLLLHDYLSGTMVVDRPVIRRQKDLAERTARFEMPSLAATGYPAQFGEFNITGLICSGTDTAVLAARDARLGRDVWIHLLKNEDAVPDTARRRCARTTRLRWLTGGRQDDWFWNAYVAVAGAPLKYWTDTESPLTWKAACPLLIQLMEEIDQSRRDATGIRISSPDQIWIDSRSRLTVVDWSWQEGSLHRTGSGRPVANRPSSSTEQKSVTTSLLSEADCRLFHEISRLALSGTCQPLDAGAVTDSSAQRMSALEPVQAVVPLHVRTMLDTIAAAAQSGQNQLDTQGIIGQLRASASKPTEANFDSRMIGLAVAFMLCSLILGAVSSLARLGNFVVMSKLQEMLLLPLAAEFLIANPAPEGVAVPAAEDLKQWIPRTGKLTHQWNQEYQKRFQGLGEFSQVVAFSARQAKEPLKETGKVQFFWKNSKLFAKNWPSEGLEHDVDLKLLSKLVSPNEAATPTEPQIRRPWLVMLITTMPFLLWILWSGLTRGGVSLWISGLTIVNSSGRLAPRWLTLLRSFVALSPMLIVQALIVWLDFTAVDSLWISRLLFQVLIGLFVVYAILTIAFPRRAPQDWIVGTHLVPR